MIWRLTSAPSEGGQSRKVRVVGAVGVMGAVRVMRVRGATDNELMI